jgi:hypothetical protein
MDPTVDFLQAAYGCFLQASGSPPGTFDVIGCVQDEVGFTEVRWLLLFCLLL